MPWYHYLSGFWSGAFFANTIPHFVKGICGDPFPTPFANPPGKGLSSPVTNVWWALLNAVVAWWLWRGASISANDSLSQFAWFAGAGALGLLMARHFSGKAKA